MSSPLFIVNPNANGGKLLARWNALKQQLPALAAMREIITPTLEQLQQTLQNEPAETRVVVVGGDGSLHQLANHAHGQEVLGLVPLGTGSDACRSLDLPTNPVKAINRVLAGDLCKADIIQSRLDGQPVKCVNVLSLGYSGQVAERVNALPRKRAWSYLEQGVKALFDRRSRAVRVSADGNVVFEGEILLMAVANGEYFGKGMRIAPGASPHNGELALVIVKNAALPIIIPHIPLLFLGWHTVSPIVTTLKAKHVLIESLTGEMPLELDGENYHAQRIEAQVQANAIRV